MDNAQFLEKMEATWANTIGKNPDYKKLVDRKNLIELQRSVEKDPTKLAKLETQLDDVNTSMIELSNQLRGRNVGAGGASSSPQTGKDPPPPPGFKVN
jgi:septal ring factor EnvC (AmiA/AmiB activator)